MKNVWITLLSLWLMPLWLIQTQVSLNPVWSIVAFQLQQIVMNLAPIFNTDSNLPIRYTI